MIFTKYKEGVGAIRAKNTKNTRLENILAHRHLCGGSTQNRIFESKDGTTSENSELD